VHVALGIHPLVEGVAQDGGGSQAAEQEHGQADLHGSSLVQMSRTLNRTSWEGITDLGSFRT